MEKIIRGKDGRIYYGKHLCADADDAYRLFRRDYHGSLGRVASYRLGRMGQREERIHGFGFCFEHPVLYESGKTNYRLLGLIGIHYWRIVGCWDWPELDDDSFERWFDAAFSEHSGMVRMVDTKTKTGRTSKRNKKCHYTKTK